MTSTADIDFTALDALRKRALIKPLRADDSLAPTGPPLNLLAVTPPPSFTPSPEAQQIASESPNPCRPPLSRLRDLVSGPSVPPSLHFVAIEPLGGAGKDRWAQAWRAVAMEGDEVVGPVVVKLLVESLFPRPEEWPIDDWWQPAAKGVEAELAAYVPLCSLALSSCTYPSPPPQLQSLSSRSRSRRSSLLRRLSLRHALG
jgi:hypothetical protein